MTQEEFKQKVESDEALKKAFKADPMKVIQENNVELSEEELEEISGGGWGRLASGTYWMRSLFDN